MISLHKNQVKFNSNITLKLYKKRAPQELSHPNYRIVTRFFLSKELHLTREFCCVH